MRRKRASASFRYKTISEARKWAFYLLRSAGIAHPGKEGDFILAYVLNIERSHMIAHPEKAINDEKLVLFKRLVKERARGVPFAYLIGRKEFMGLNFSLNREVFIPRPESELLVENALDWLRHNHLDLRTPINIADLCTGSGAVGLALAYYISKDFTNEIAVTLSDNSVSALEKAKENAVALDVSHLCEFVLADLFEGLNGHDKHQKYHIITINPPYISPTDYPQLSREVQSEPSEALIAFPDGLSFYRRIAQVFDRYLEQRGILVLEVGDGQAEEVCRLFTAKHYNFNMKKDLAGKDRVVEVYKTI